ncbi:MAG: ATP-binding protein [Polyangiaceae bacterium]
MQEVSVQHRADVLLAQQLVRRWAESIGFSRTACAELMIVASELATNIVKYGKRGVLRAERVEDPELGVGLRITAEDEGPPFKSFETAQRDGFNDERPLELSELLARRGTASGLGAVRRLMHELSHTPLPVGKSVSATRYLHVPLW